MLLRLGVVAVFAAMALELAAFFAAIHDSGQSDDWRRVTLAGHLLLWTGFAALLLAPRVRSLLGRHAQVLLAAAGVGFEIVALAKAYDENAPARAFTWSNEAYALVFGALALGAVAAPLAARSARLASAALLVAVVCAGAYAMYLGSDLQGFVWEQAAIVVAVLVAAAALPRRA